MTNQEKQKRLYYEKRKAEKARCKVIRDLLGSEGTFAIQSMEVIDTFLDDYLGGIIKINDSLLGFWWCGWEVLAAVKYNDREAVLTFIKGTGIQLNDPDDEILGSFALPDEFLK